MGRVKRRKVKKVKDEEEISEERRVKGEEFNGLAKLNAGVSKGETKHIERCIGTYNQVTALKCSGKSIEKIERKH